MTIARLFAKTVGTKRHRAYFEAEWIFEPRDCWFGVYWKRYPQAVEVYLCLVPMLPLRFYVQWH